MFGNIYADLNLTSYLTFRTQFDYNFQLTNNTALQEKFSAGVNSFPSGMVQQVNNSLFWAWKNYLSFNKGFGHHNLSATAGYEAQLSKYEFIQGASINLFTNEQVALNNGTAQPVSGAPFVNSLASYFGRVGYTYNDRYSLNLAFRGDAASTFGPNNKWGYFPAASLGWTVTKEKFAEAIPALNYLKLRVGAGVVGNRNAPSGAPQPPYTAGITTSINGFGPGTMVKNVANPDLKWEQVVTYNAGFDATFLKRKVDLTVDVYKKQTQNMLLYSSAPTFVGLGIVALPIVNAGQMTNKGIDIGLTTYNINNKNFSWKTNAIFTHYKNRLDKLVNERSALTGNVVYGTITVTRTVPGYPVGSFYGATTDGLFTEKEAASGAIPVQFGLQPATSATTAGTWAGDIKMKDLSGPNGVPDGNIDNFDVGFIGNPHPKFTYGLTNSFSFGGVDVSVFLQGSYGAQIYNFLGRYLEGVENLFNNQLVKVMNRYTAANPNGTIPRFTSANKNNTTISDRFVESGSFLRIQNVSIGYNVPKTFIQKAHLSNLRVYISAQNLYTFTKYSGYDPEIGAFNQSITLMNVDNGHYPNPRSFTAGLNVEF
jgi:TonB-linked SusC/RagA family outer membrane protein